MKPGAVRVALTATAVAAMATVGGCSSGEGSGDEGDTLEFQTAMAVDSPVYAELEDLTAQYEEDNPGVKIDLQTGGSDYEAQIKVRLAARDLPDIWATHGWSLQRYGQFLAPLDDQPWAADLNEVLDPVMRDEEGRIYALPVTMAAAGLVVNTTVLDQVGVDPATLTSWDALATAADKIAAAGIVPFHMAGSKDGSAANTVDWLAPGAFTADELEAFERGEFQGPAYEKLLGVLEGMREDGWINPDYTSATRDDTARAFAEDKTAFAMTSNTLIAEAWKYNPDAALTYVPVPPVDGTGDPYLIGGEDTAFGVAKDGEHVDAALDYLAFLAEPENVAAMAKLVGNPPGLTSAKADLGPLNAPYKEFVLSAEVPLEPFFDRVYLPNGLWDTVMSTSDGVVAGTTTTAEATETMAADFATLYQQAE